MFSKSKLLLLAALVTLFFSVSSPALAQEGGGEGNNKQTPVQVIVQIVITVSILRILHKFNLP